MTASGDGVIWIRRRGWGWMPSLALLLVCLPGLHGQRIQGESTDLREYCEGDEFQAECAEDEIILIQAAFYGRMRLGTCIQTAGELGCQEDILPYLDKLCSGRHRCRVRVSSMIDILPAHLQPCSMDYRSYLEAAYRCQSVAHAPPELCVSTPEVELSAASQYLASIVTQETACGSTDCPWVIRVPPGQTIEIALYDFAAVSRVPTGSDVCHVYAVIKEPVEQISHTVCAPTTREKVVHVSTTNVVEVRVMVNSNADEDYFALHYQVRGCPSLAAPAHGWVKRQGDVSTLGCNGSKEQPWTLTCQEGRWVGITKNCTADGTGGGGGTTVTTLLTGSQWASVAVILAIAVTLGLLIFLIGFLVLRRRRSLPGRGPGTSQGRMPIPDYYSAAQIREGCPSPYSAKPLSSIDYSSSENDYYRTWQLQRHPAGGRQVLAHGEYPGREVAILCPAHAAGSMPYHGVESQQRTDHIYESPKFDRRDFSRDIPYEGTSDLGRGGRSTPYNELEPELPENRRTT